MNSHIRMAFLVCLTALAVSGGAWLHGSLVNRRSEHLRALNDEEESLQQQLEFSVRNLQETGSIANARPPDETGDGMAALLQRIVRDLDQLQVKDRSLTTGEPFSMGSAHLIPLNLNFKGGFSAVFELLQRFKDYQRRVQLERLTISRAPDAPVNSLSVSMRLNTFTDAEAR